MDFSGEQAEDYTTPRLKKQTLALVQVLREMSKDDLQELMEISDDLAKENYDRFQIFRKTFTSVEARRAIDAFQGDVYTGLQAGEFDQGDLDYAQDHLRILSGLYGILRPKDLIQPYRLEMGTDLKINGHSNLYGFWGNNITRILKRDLKGTGSNTIVDLASNEYTKVVDYKRLKADVLEVKFREKRKGRYMFISFNAKKARGAMAAYMIKNRVDDREDLKGFEHDGYVFNKKRSSPSEYHFIKE